MASLGDVPNLDSLFTRYANLDSEFRVVSEPKESGEEFLDPSSLLITFPRSVTRRFESVVRCRYDEFTALCPWTNHPDQGTVEIEYKPRTKLIELKSLKYFFEAFRSIHITQEHFGEYLVAVLVDALDPESVNVRLDYMTRGGIHTVWEGKR